MLKILVPDQGEIAYRRAGEAFRDLYEKITGTAPDIIDQYEPDTDLVVIGSDAVNDFTARAFAENWIDSFHIRYGTDDYAVRSVETGGQTYLFLAGGRGRSTLYAVYDFFERAAGCHYYWDGDVIPRSDAVPLGGLNVSESPRFDWRGRRYFAHRGLHRFQAEHWSLDDWKREIDWLLKRRMNYFMLRIGHDDVFQRAFPDIVDYPNASEKLPEAKDGGDGYDDRTLFWPLEFRSMLRKKVLEYAFERDMIHSEDCGTMTHWYSRTPIQYLEKKKPILLSQTTSGYNQQTGQCWDPRVRENMDNYMKLTDVYANYYGKPEVFHTIGLAERHFSKDLNEEKKLKLFTYRRILQRIREKYPMSKMLIASWDFHTWWRQEDVTELLRELDPSRTLILDYTSDNEYGRKTFPSWDIVGKFPRIFGIFHGFEGTNNVHGDYALIGERLRIAREDPMCRGMIVWPEMAHTDTLMLEYFARNSWRPDQLSIETLTEDFARQRYGKYAAEMNAAWQAFLPIVELSGRLASWSDGSFTCYLKSIYALCYRGVDKRMHHAEELIRCASAFNDHPSRILTVLAGLPEEAWADPFVRRDAVDIARSLLEHWGHWAIMLLFSQNEAGDCAGVLVTSAAVMRLSEALMNVVACHEDFSLYRTLVGLEKVCPVNPLFEHTLKFNYLANYCRQDAYEAYRYVYLEEQKAFFGWVDEQARAGQRIEWNNTFKDIRDALTQRFFDTPLAEMQSPCAGDLPAVLREAAEAVRAIRFPAPDAAAKEV